MTIDTAPTRPSPAHRPPSEDDLALDTAEAAEALLPADSGTSGLKAFFAALFRGAPPEDITSYAPESLVALAARAFEKSARRKPGETIVDVFPFRAQNRQGERNETILVAVNDDMPFLFDSLIAELSAQGIRVHALFHPVVPVKRDTTGTRSDTGLVTRESVIVLSLDPLPSDERRSELAEGARHMFRQVKLAVGDWPRMIAHVRSTVQALQAHPPRISPELVRESIAFLEWLANNHFTFLGARDYVYSDANGGSLTAVPQSGLGVLSDMETRVIRRGEDRGGLTAEVRGFLAQAEPLIITKSNERSVVHRRVHMDYIGVKMFDANGRLSGERRFVGLFTSGAYSRRAGDIPLLRLKVERVRERAGFPPNSHDGKALAHILDSFPRDELFQVSEEELFDTALGILRLGERPKVKVFVRCDRFDRFVSLLVYVPRDRYDTHAREKIHRILARAYDGRMSASNPTMDNSVLARVHYIIGRHEGVRPHVDVRALEVEIAAAIRTWEDAFHDALVKRYGDVEGTAAFVRLRDALPARYRDAFSPEEAVSDLGELQRLAEGDDRIQARAYRTSNDERSDLRLKIYVLGDVLPLSASLPVFENLGFRVIAEDSYEVTLDTGRGWKGEAAVLDFQMERADGGSAELAPIKDRLEAAFRTIVADDAENDGFNRLIVAAGVDWYTVNILRACAKYLRQAGFSFSQDYIEQALARNPDIARLLIELFHARHGLEVKDRDRAQETVRGRIDAALNDVPSLDDDRIVRRLRNVIECSLRTNFYQRDDAGGRKSYLAIKLDSQKLDELPAPRPLYEIFVYSPQVEGVHLRFGKVARGGLRWSDRREDFRTEVLGLVKAQQVKNAVIVPVGAKGGFYPKRLPLNAAREEVQAAAISAYKTFIHALLDLTDNIGPDGAVIPPAGVVRHDGDDPYLVVAADKGTATFSDIANGIAESRGFWLGDAFASGGSHGYDHKKMGITAKGAWEAVKRHFREMGRDIQNEAFTASALATCRATCSATACCCRNVPGSSRPSITATFSSIPIRMRPQAGTSASACSTCRVRSWEDYDKSLISKGRRRLRAQHEGDSAFAGDEGAIGTQAGSRRPGRVDEGAAQGRDRPAVVWRHRHLCKGIGAEQSRCRRSCQ